MNSIRRITTVTISALLTGIATVTGASSAFAQAPLDTGTGSGSGAPAPVTGGGTPTLTYVLVAAAAILIVAFVMMTARTLRAHTRRSHVVRPA